MKYENIQNLATFLNSVIENKPIRINIVNPQYQSFYFDIFFDEVNTGKMPFYDSFCDVLAMHLKNDNKNYKQVTGEFMTVWTAWIHLYEELIRRRII